MKNNLTIYFLTYLLLCLLTSCTTYKNIPPVATSTDNDLQKENIKGKVKTVKELNYEIIKKENGLTQEKLTWKRVLQFNIEGNKTSEHRYQSTGELASYEIYEYDNEGHPLAMSSFSANGELEEKYTFQYNNENQKIEEQYLLSDENPIWKATHEYDEKGNKTKVTFWAGGEIEKIWTYRYDKKGNPITHEWHNGDGSLHSKQTRTFDAKGNEIEYIEYSSDGQIITKCTSKYHKKEKKDTQCYNGSGNLTGSNTRVYDQQKNIILQTDFGLNPNDKFTHTYEYTYDRIGNWTIKRSFSNERLSGVDKREVVYY